MLATLQSIKLLSGRTTQTCTAKPAYSNLVTSATLAGLGPVGGDTTLMHCPKWPTSGTRKKRRSQRIRLVRSTQPNSNLTRCAADWRSSIKSLARSQQALTMWASTALRSQACCRTWRLPTWASTPVSIREHNRFLKARKKMLHYQNRWEAS